MNKPFRPLFLFALLASAVSLHAAKISGTVTNRNTGDPVEGARVIVAGLNQGAASDTTTTDAKGAYGFDSVSTGFKTLVATKTGFQSNTANVNALQNNGNYTANIGLMPVNGNTQSGAISGTVKDDATKENIKGATVILSHPAGRGGATPIDTVVTDGEGRFFFPVVPAATNYIVTASASGYSEATNENVDVANKDTAAVPLTLKALPKPNAAILGKVRDTGTKSALANAVVILRRRATVGGQAVWENLDTLVCDETGLFKFSNLQPSTQTAPYSLLASSSGYVSGASGNIIVANNVIDTVDVLLAKVAKGSMYIYVGQDTAKNPALTGASVAASMTGPSGEVYTGTTDDKGWVTFSNVVTGSYSVSANLSGFVSKAVTRTVTADEKDTGFIYLARATVQNSKSLSGLVRDVDGKALEGAKLVFEATGANGIVLSATSSATGDYAFSGIPTNVTGGTVTVEMDGFATFTGTVTLSGAASFLNVNLKKAATSLAATGDAMRFRMVRNGGSLTLEFPASASAGTLSLFDVRGSQVASMRIPAGSNHADLASAARASGARYLMLTQGASSRKLAIPSAR